MEENDSTNDFESTSDMYRNSLTSVHPENSNKASQVEIKSSFQLVMHFIKNLPAILHWFEFAWRNRYFVESSMVRHFLRRLDFKNMKDTDFIKYSNWKYYYPADRKTFKCNESGKIVDIVVPYKEVIDFTSGERITMSISPDISDYKSSDNLKSLTDKAFNTYLKAKPKTTDGPIVRLSKLEMLSGNEFKVTLQRSTYFEQVRTNLTLDYGLQGGSTLRAQDLLGTTNNSLPEFEYSQMVNSIGVSAVVFYSKGTKKYFFMKLRRDSTGIFETMFSTTSGVLELPDDHQSDLVALAKSEMLREFSEETGVPNDLLPKVNVIPLSFTRELIRGGKPQFFFLLEISEEMAKDFPKYFKKSQDGNVEFNNGRFEKVISYSKSGLSPEFATNLLYAYRYFNIQLSLGNKPIKL